MDRAEHDDGADDCAGNDREGDGRDHACPTTTTAETQAHACACRNGSRPSRRAPVGYRGADCDQYAGARRPVSANGAQIRFTSNEAGARFACKLARRRLFRLHHARCFLQALPPATIASVRATDRAGNVGKPASVQWRYVPAGHDLPTVTLTSTPAASTIETSASFAFTASEPDVAFECSLDSSAYARRQPGASTSHSASARTSLQSAAATQPATWAAGELRLVDRCAPPPPPPPPRLDL